MRALVLMLALCATGAQAHDDHAHAAGERDHSRTPAGPAPVAKTTEGEIYGAALPATRPAAVDIDAVAADAKPHLGKPGAFSGRITQVCQKKGCWLVLAGEKGELARVFMHDHAFSVPKDASGQAVVYGTLSEKALSEAEIAHLKSDGAKAPTPRELQIDADTVLIKTAG